jgi:hypothetical protein
MHLFLGFIPASSDKRFAIAKIKTLAWRLSPEKTDSLWYGRGVRNVRFQENNGKDVFIQ